MEEELTLSQKYERFNRYNALLDEPENLLRYITLGTSFRLLIPRDIFELILKNIQENWYDTVNDWIERMKKGETIGVDNRRISLTVLHDVFDYIDSIIQIYTIKMNPMEEEKINQGLFNYSKFQRFWFLYHDLVYEMVLQLKKVDDVLEEMDQENQQGSDSDIRIEETKPTLSEIDITNETKPVPKKKQQMGCKDISDNSNKDKPREPRRKGNLSYLFEKKNKKRVPKKSSEVEELVTEAANEVFQEKDLNRESLNKKEDSNRIKEKAIEKLLQKTQDKLDGKLTSKKPETKKKEKKEKPQKRPVPEPEKHTETKVEKSNPLDALYAAGILNEESIDRVKEEQIKQEKFEKKEIDLTEKEDIEEVNIKEQINQMNKMNKKSEKQRDAAKPHKKNAEKHKIKKEIKKYKMTKDELDEIQLIKNKEITKSITDSDNLKIAVGNRLLEEPRIILFLKIEELKEKSKWVLIDTPVKYKKDIIFSEGNTGYINIGKKSIQVPIRDIKETRKAIYDIMTKAIREETKKADYATNKKKQEIMEIINNWIQEQLPSITIDYLKNNVEYNLNREISEKGMILEGTLLYVNLGKGINLKIEFKTS